MNGENIQNKNGIDKFIINEEQAVTVRYIYKRYLEGYSTYKIACELTEMGVKTRPLPGKINGIQVQ